MSNGLHPSAVIDPAAQIGAASGITPASSRRLLSTLPVENMQMRRKFGSASLPPTSIFRFFDDGSGFLFTNGQFLRDDGTRFTLARLINQRSSNITFTAVPPGEGRRIGIDRDSNGVLDAQERDSSEACSEDD